MLGAWLETWLAPGFAAWRLDDDLRQLRCPVLALHGDRDEYGSTAHPERISGVPASAARAVILKDCGHVSHREQPEAVLTQVAAFLREIPADSGGV